MLQLLIKAENKGYNLIPLTPTPTTFHEVNVTYHNIKLRGKTHYELTLNGDIHAASPEFLKEFWEYSINRTDKRKSSGLIHMGDAAENNNKDSPGYSQFEQRATNEQAEDYIKKIHKKIRNKIWVWHEGNHGGERTRNKTGLSTDRHIAEVLNVPYSRISCYHIIDWNNHRLILYTNHGKKRTTPTWRGTKNKLLRESRVYKNADIICLGHIHKLKYVDLVPDENVTENIIIDYENQSMIQEEATFKKALITGCFLSYLGGYGQKDGYTPIKPGYPIIKLYPDGSYDVEKVWYKDFINGTL